MPLHERCVTPVWVIKHGFWKDPGAIKRHVAILVNLGFLVQDQVNKTVWWPSLNPDVQAVVTGRQEVLR